MNSSETENYGPRVRELLQLLEQNTQDSENGLGESVKSIDMSSTGLGKQVRELGHELAEKGIQWEDVGATPEEARYLRDLYRGEVGQ